MEAEARKSERQEHIRVSGIRQEQVADKKQGSIRGD